jgi:hypothetical protein
VAKTRNHWKALLRSLLYQILSANPKLLNAVTESFGKWSVMGHSNWSRQQLEKSFALVTAQTSNNISICLFLDALDEYDGDPESVVSFLRSIVATPRDSLSSRLYNIFIDEFGNVLGFKIHERTQQDIERVITGRLSTSQGINDILASGNEQVREQFWELKSQLVGRAEGVFLWVRLALDNILRVHREGGTMADVLRLVSSLPDELDEFYQMIIVKNVLPEHRREAYVILETVLRYDSELTAQDLSGVLACSFAQTLRHSAREPASAVCRRYRISVSSSS